MVAVHASRSLTQHAQNDFQFSGIYRTPDWVRFLVLGDAIQDRSFDRDALGIDRVLCELGLAVLAASVWRNPGKLSAGRAFGGEKENRKIALGRLANAHSHS